jgi:hypothetical protein
MKKIRLDDPKLKYPGIHNIYPIMNETSMHSNIEPLNSEFSKQSEHILDTNYGRILNTSVGQPYGDSKSMGYYFRNEKFKIIDNLRVPFRKIPVFKFIDLAQVSSIIQQIEKENPDFEILLRGQTNIYKIKRSSDELKYLYGDSNCTEPSFQPSFLRSNFDEYFIKNLWHNQTSSMFNDVGIDLKNLISENDLKIYYNDVNKIKGHFHFTPIALGYAQHYGLPSIGLDLTKDLKVALWFASHKMNIQKNGLCELSKLDDFKKSTLFIFRSPKDTVFSHREIKPKKIINTRPDKQDAWFCHTGWGDSKNQLATNLCCAIRLDSDILNEFDDNYGASLFPNRTEDLVLNYFLDMKNRKENMNEVKRALNKIYYLSE